MRFGAYIFWAAVAVAAGFFVLLGYFIDLPVVTALRLLLMQWAVLLAAAALLVGLVNLLLVHWNKVSLQEPDWPYSSVLLLFFLITLTLGLIFGPGDPVVLFLFNNVQVPVEAALTAVLAVTLIYAGVRLLSRRRDLWTLIFLGTALLVLAGTTPWLLAQQGEVFQLVADFRTWVTQVWAAAGARGILLGVALGAIATGLRVLLAVDRPYGD